jgi:beta-glucosidase
VTVTADPRLLGRFDEPSGRWSLAAGRYRIAVGKSAGDLCLHAEVRLAARLFGT